jgi:putative component of toxin-antitoxin plasmid stabilization module
VIEIRQTEQYAKWFSELRDRQARARIYQSRAGSGAYSLGVYDGKD